MKAYQISKYDPAKRNSKGFYLEHDWTAISDIGKTYNGIVLTKGKYLEIENSYISVLSNITKSAGVLSFKIKDLKKLRLTDNNYQDLYSKDILSVFKNVSTGKILNLSDMLIVARLMLREDLHGTIEGLNVKLIIEFGYDYYMYITLKDELFPDLKKNCNEQNLFIE